MESPIDLYYDGLMSLIKYDEEGTAEDLDTAISTYEEALATTSESHPGRTRGFVNLSNAYIMRYKNNSAMEDLERAIQRSQSALDATPHDHQDLGSRHTELGQCYSAKYERSSSTKDIGACISHFQQALDATPDTSPGRSAKCYDLAAAYRTRYERDASVRDLDSAVEMYERGLDVTPNGDRIAARLMVLGALHTTRCQRTKSTGDLDVRIQRYHKYLESASDGTRNLSQLGCLATLYEVDFKSTGKIESLEQALRLWKEILDASSENHPDYIYWIQKPASTCWLKYLKTKRTEDLDQCILLGKASLDKTPDNDNQRAVRLSELASAYARRFDILGAMADLNQAIQLCEESLEKATEHEDPRLRDIVIDELVGLFKDRLERTKSNSDMDRLLPHVQKSLDQTPDGHSSRASLLYTMASAYYYRFINTKHLVDSEQSIRYHNEALEAGPEDPDDIADYLHSLSNVYEERFWVTDSPSDIQQATEISKQALDRIPEDHLERTDYLTALADLYALVRKGNVVNLDEAIELYQQALEITQEAEGEAYLLSCLGLAHWNRFNESNNPADFQQSTHFYHRLLDFPTSHVKNRIQAGIYLLDQYATTKRWAQAYEAACQALSLFPLLTPHFLQTSDKQNVLVSGSTHNLGSDAAAAALMAGKEASEAIQLLELGRGIIASSQYDMRSDVSDLQRQHPEIAREYLELRDRLEVGEKNEEDYDTSDALDAPNERYDASKKLQEKIKEIQDIPGFDDFLSAPSESELLAASEKGAIVVINVSKYRCDAFLIHNNEFRLVPLPHLEIIGLGGRITALSSLEPHTEVLEWLWDTIAEPVLKELGFTTKPQSGRWPRLWWIPTGPITSFPLHAAGYHDRGSDTVLDRVISSYSTSIKALSQSLRAQKQTFTANHADQAVLVSMANTPGQAYLPYVSQEMNNLSSFCDSMSLETIIPQPHLSDVLGALKSCKLFHFAGHGRTHASDPSKSALLLRDDELTVANLFEINLHERKPFLAYLSACGTGRVLDGKLLNEAIHLTAAFQLAGFQHVIGTLWNVNDDASVKMATMVYKWMKDQGISDESVSEGLHYASRELRNQWIQEGAVMRDTLRNPMSSSGQQATVEATRSSDGVQRDARDVMGFGDAPLYWIPFVHFGI